MTIEPVQRGPMHDDVTHRGDPAGGTAAATVPIAALRPADSPRLRGIDEAHARMLAESATPLPPILVNRRHMRVIDGMHRLRAAQLRGLAEVAVTFVDHDDDAAFLRAVAANSGHGLPLSLEDRRAAAARITASYPDWSDRAVARAAGVSPKTVGALRRRTGDHMPTARLGQDGKIRPINAEIGRRRAEEIIAANPDASLREIATAAGISPTTARDVRDRLRLGHAPTTARTAPATATIAGAAATAPAGAATATTAGAALTAPGPDAGGAPGLRRAGQPLRAVRPSDDGRTGRDDRLDLASVMANLRRDPSVRYTDSGRAMLRWLDRYLIHAVDGGQLASTVPPHCLPILARLARQSARTWQNLADQLELHTRKVA